MFESTREFRTARGTPNQHLTQVAGFVLPGLMVVAFGRAVQRTSFGVLNLWVLVFAVVVWSRVTPPDPNVPGT